MSGLTLAVLLLGQAAPATAPGTEVRALTVTLVDEKSGAPVNVGLRDVALLENGTARDIVSFKPDTRPLSVAILVDSSEAMGSAFRLNLVEAVSGFVARLPEATRYSVWTTGDRPTKVLDFTEDRQEAKKALRLVVPRGGNYMLDGLVEASEDLRKHGREGDRTAVLAVTGTGPEFSYRDRYHAADEAEGNADLYLAVQIDAGGDDFETQAVLSYVLGRLANATGGSYAEILSPMGVDTALRLPSDRLRAGYRLSYATVTDLKKRKLDLTVARPATRVLVPDVDGRRP
jgi:hypothetical protein